jgi:integrase
MLKESNVRKGFFEHNEYLALKSTLPDYLKPVVTFAYHSGWRKSEILNLTWNEVDIKEGIVRIYETKNEQGRVFYMDEKLLSEVKTLFLKRRLDCPYVFNRDGKPINDFRAAWDSACIKAGLFEVIKNNKTNEVKVPTKIFHDFRRTAVRNMIRSGIPERVAMEISGHKTRSVFDRYNIISDQDLKEAAKKRQDYYEKQNSMAEEIISQKGQIMAFKKAQET